MDICVSRLIGWLVGRSVGLTEVAGWLVDLAAIESATQLTTTRMDLMANGHGAPYQKHRNGQFRLFQSLVFFEWFILKVWARISLLYSDKS